MAGGLIGALRVSLSAETAKFEAGMKRAQRTTASTASSINKSLGLMKASLAGLAGGLSVGLLARGFIAAADAAKRMDAQLKLATAASGNFAKAQQDVVRIAQLTRTGLEETANLYATFQRNAVELGISQEQAARATETVSKAFQISGATAAEASGGLRQFLQGIQSGTLRGEELNSVLENAPRLARLLADSLGVTIGQLRAMGKEGELTGDKLIKALTDRKFTDGIDAEFKELPVTFGQAMTQVQNAAIITFGAFDRGGEFSKALVNFISDGADGFDDLAVAAENLGIEIRATFEGLSDAFEPLFDGARSVFGRIEGEANSLRDSLASLFGAFDDAANFLPRLGNRAKAFDNRVFGTNWQPEALSDSRGRFLSGFNKSATERRRRMILSPEAASRALAEFGPAKPPGPARVSAGSGKTKKGRTAKPPRDRSEQVEFQFNQELMRSQMDILRARSDLARTSDERAVLELQMLDLEKQANKAELDHRVSQAERDYAEKKITKGTLEQVKAQAKQLEADYETADALKRQAIAEDLVAQKAEDAARLKDTEYDIQIEKLDIESDLATTAKQRRDVELRILDAMQAQERARLEAVLADQKSSDLAKDKARKRLDALNANAGARREQVMRNTAGPLESAKLQFSDLTDEMENLKVNGIMAAGDALATLATEGFGSFKEQAISAIKAVIAEFIRLQTIKFIMNAVGSAMGAPGVGAGFGGGASPFSNPVMGFATGGAFTVMGRHGVDNNIMSLNGLPIARVSHGERVSVSNDNARGGSPVNINFALTGPVSRETMGQIAAKTKLAIASANRKGM